MGLMPPPRAMMGNNTRGSMAMALSVVFETAEMERPSRSDHGRDEQDKEVVEEVTVQPAAQVDDGQHGAALEDAQRHENGELGKNVREEFEGDHALALVDGPLADDVTGGVVAAEPDGSYHHEEMNDGHFHRQVAEVHDRISSGLQGIVDQNNQYGEQWRLRQQDCGLGAVLEADNDVALNQG